jgi:hypothetical protein
LLRSTKEKWEFKNTQNRIGGSEEREVPLGHQVGSRKWTPRRWQSLKRFIVMEMSSGFLPRRNQKRSPEISARLMICNLQELFSSFKAVEAD